MMASKKTAKISFILSRTLGQKGKDPFSLKILSNEKILELYTEARLPDEDFDKFITEYRKIMAV